MTNDQRQCSCTVSKLLNSLSPNKSLVFLRETKHDTNVSKVQSSPIKFNEFVFNADNLEVFLNSHWWYILVNGWGTNGTDAKYTGV